MVTSIVRRFHQHGSEMQVQPFVEADSEEGGFRRSWGAMKSLCTLKVLVSEVKSVKGSQTGSCEEVELY